MKLAGYNFKGIHIPGSQTPCDYGSRAGCPKKSTFSEDEIEEYGVEDDSEIYVNRLVEEQIPRAVTRKERQGVDTIDRRHQQRGL